MAIEPLSSAMTVQMTGTVSAVKAVANRDAAAEDGAKNENISVESKEAAKADTTINVVDQAKNKSHDKYDNEDIAGRKSQEQINEQIRKSVEQLNKNISPHSEAIFGIHEKTNRVTIKIVDKDSKEVIREFPPEKTLDMIAKVWELAGILVDEKR